ncbi:MAG TPA: hypothetical protein VNO52_18045 [Methylomirabilota bacterium]|nr:hypothetical protein [Methylomirabilota bacterium]
MDDLLPGRELGLGRQYRSERQPHRTRDRQQFSWCYTHIIFLPQFDPPARQHIVTDFRAGLID